MDDALPDVVGGMRGTPKAPALAASVSTCSRLSGSAMPAARPSVGTLWSGTAKVRSGRRTARRAARSLSKACGLVTSCTRWRSM